MEANTTTLFFKETIVAKETMEANDGDVDPTLPMLNVVENCFHLHLHHHLQM
jgi:hypothetical protein